MRQRGVEILAGTQRVPRGDCLIWAKRRSPRRPQQAREGQYENPAVPRIFKITSHASHSNFAATQSAASSFAMRTKRPLGATENRLEFSWERRSSVDPHTLAAQRLLGAGRGRRASPVKPSLCARTECPTRSATLERGNTQSFPGGRGPPKALLAGDRNARQHA